jgi:uncharacterized repeat protein (TIGR01451 family)
MNLCLTNRVGSRGEKLLAFAALVALFAQTAHAGKIRYTYDGADRLVALDFGGGTNTVFTYDKNGNLLRQATSFATTADVQLTKGATTSSPVAGNLFQYIFTAVNNGPHPATGVTVTDPLPFGILFNNFVTISQGSAVLSNRTVIAHFGTLPAGSNAVLRFFVQQGITGSVTNTAVVAAGQTDANPANNTSSRITTALAAPDSDADGMPDWWETRAFGSFTNAPGDDPDGDGMSNLGEYVADTNPVDGASYFRIEEVAVGTEAAVLSLWTSPIRRYTAQFVPELGGPMFSNLLTFEGTGLPLEVPLTNPPPTGFYRVIVIAP